MTPYVQDSDFTLYLGDALEVLRGLPDESVHCCVTSPPYWGLRDYGTEGQIGLEATPEAFVEAMVAVFREVRRVLRADGTLWLNLGDSYVSQGGPQVPQTKAHRGSGLHGANRHPDTWTEAEYEEYDRAHQDLLDNPPDPAEVLRGKRLPRGKGRWGGGNVAVASLKPKDLVGIPWRVAFALQADGWYLRSDIVWSKPNPMPESVTDRPTKAHEYVFLLTRSPRYFFDQEAVREPAEWARWGDQTVGKGSNPDGWIKPKGKNELIAKHAPGSAGRRQAGFNERWDASEANGTAPTGRNIRSVWEIATQPYPEAHFATFPEALPERCIKAGTSERGCCPECGAAWERATDVAYEKSPVHGSGSVVGRHEVTGANNYDGAGMPRLNKVVTTTGWLASCDCSIDGNEHLQPHPVPCTVLDPFMGSGTTALVARRLGRKSIGIELNEQYAQLAARRLSQLSLLAEA